MTGVEVFLAIVKILIVIVFLLSMAALTTWADRRQGAMVQDRVGPNRAVVYLPSNVARVLVLLPPSLFGAIAGFVATRELTAPGALEAMGIGTQLAILVTWLGLLLLRGAVRLGGAINRAEEALGATDPRTLFYAGLAAHMLGFFVTRVVPLDAAPTGARVATGMLAALLFASGVYAASRVPDGKVPLRLIGILHTVADSIKMIWKEDFVPKHADRLLHTFAPMLAVFASLVTFAVIPFGDRVCFGDDGDKVFGFADLLLVQRSMGPTFRCTGHTVSLQVADLNVGILYLFAMAGTGVIGAAIAGWSSDNKYSLLGGLRAASQMVSYEVSMGLSLVGLFVIYGSVRMQPMVEWQGANAWGIFVQPFAFVLFLAALVAETKRVPFDAPEGESEIVAGYIVEYSGFKWGMFYTGEYVEFVTSSALLVTLFFGGYTLPFLNDEGVRVAFGGTTLFAYKMTHLAVSVIQVIAFFGKTVLMVFLQIFIRWALPRFRYDQVMRLGWTKLLPLAIVNILVTGVVVLAIDTAPAGLRDGLAVAGQVTHAIVAVGAVVVVVMVIRGLLEPVERKRFLGSTAARFAAAAGGTKASPRQA
jgi:NADH-quinone oxidoreductase subunit H